MTPLFALWFVLNVHSSRVGGMDAPKSTSCRRRDQTKKKLRKS